MAKLILISPDVMAGKEIWGGQQTTCWITSSKNGNFAWATNPLSSSITGYKLENSGKLELSEEIAYNDPDYNEYFTDMDLSADGNYINVLSGNTGKVWVFAINHNNGALTLVNGFEGGAKVHTYGMVNNF